MFEPRLTEQDWLKLLPSIRTELVRIFKIPRSKGALVEDSIVKSDGHTYDDLKSISVQALQEYLKSDSNDFSSLFNDAVHNITLIVNEKNKSSIPIENYTEKMETYIRMFNGFREHMLTVGLRELFDHRIFDILKVNIKPDVQKKEGKNKGGNSEGDGVKEGRNTTEEVR